MKLNTVSGREIETETLFCLHCDQEFQAEDLIVEGPGDQKCPTNGCNGMGVGWDLYAKRWWEEQR